MLRDTTRARTGFQTLSILLLGCCLAALGCGGNKIAIQAGPMPTGGRFSGTWHSPRYGDLQLSQSGNTAFGSYVGDERRGRLEGTVEGDLLRFRWTEKRELVQGHPTKLEGHGYFRYIIGNDGRHYILGEWGVGEADHGGGQWRAYKLKKGPAPRAPSADDDSDSGSGVDGFVDEAATESSH